MDARKAFRSVLRDYGHDVYLQRRLPDDPSYPHPQPRFSDRLEKHTTRHMHPSSVGLARVGEERMEGVVTSLDIVYWFTYDVSPKEGDRIYEGDPRLPDGYSTWLIDYAHPMRGRGGRITFWACGVTRERPD